MKVTQNTMKASLKSQYDLVMEEFEREGKVVTYGEEENSAIIKALNNGMEDFLYTQKLNEKASELELSGIILNA